MERTALSVALAPFLVIAAGYLLARFVRKPLQKRLKDGRLKRLLLYRLSWLP